MLFRGVCVCVHVWLCVQIYLSPQVVPWPFVPTPLSRQAQRSRNLFGLDTLFPELCNVYKNAQTKQIEINPTDLVLDFYG